MHEKKEINIVIAMQREANFLIKYWNLKQVNLPKKIFVNKKKKINLIISGIGKIKQKKQQPHWLKKQAKILFF